MTVLQAASPLPKLYRHPIRWTHTKVQTLGTSLLLGHIGVLAVVGLYYVLFEAWHPATNVWHHLVSSNHWRHLVRNVGEGLFGAMLAQQMLWNPFKVKLKKANLFDRLELKLRIPNLHQEQRISAGQLLSAPLVAALYAIPGFLLGALGVSEIHALFHTEHVRVALSGHPSIVEKFYTSNWDQKLVGFIAGVFMARRPMKQIFSDVQIFFAERRIALGKRARFYHPPAFRAVIKVLRDQYGGQIGALRRQAAHGKLVATLMTGSILLTLAFAGFGYYVLSHIAKS